MGMLVRLFVGINIADGSRIQAHKSKMCLKSFRLSSNVSFCHGIVQPLFVITASVFLTLVIYAVKLSLDAVYTRRRCVDNIQKNDIW